MAQTFKKGSSRTERLGYVPLEKRLAQLQMAGIRTMVSRDRLSQLGLLPAPHHYDAEGKVVRPPPLPRHLEPDMADVSELYRKYQARKREIETRVREEGIEKVRAEAQPQPEGSKGPPDPLPPEAPKATK